jgi:hypothetical protein
MKILQDCESIKEKVAQSVEKLGYEERDKLVLDGKLDESEDILKTLKANAELVDMAPQTKKFQHFTTTHKAVVDLYHRLKELKDPILDDLLYALQKI